MLMNIFFIMLFFLLGFVFILIRNTLRFVPQNNQKLAKQNTSNALDIVYDKEKAISDLQQMIRCKTISSYDKSQEDDAEFKKFIALLEGSFPTIHEKAERKFLGSRGVLFIIKGKSSAKASVFMSHYDVVSAEESGWSKPAFEGIIEDGYLWGRGTLDTKQSLNAIMQSAEALLTQGFVPENDMYLSFAGNEEVTGDDAPAIVDFLQNNGVSPNFVLDEGGAVVNNIFPGAKGICALIGTAEKGVLNIEYTAISNGGHSSAPKVHTCIGDLAKVCVNIENNPFKARLVKPVEQMFDCLGRHSSFLYRMIFANLWVFKGLLFAITKKTGGELSALVRTTVAFTMCEGSKGANVLPAKARFVSNSRILSGESVDGTIANIKKLAHNKNININVINGVNPSKVSITENVAEWDLLQDVIRQTWGNIPISPYLMFACSDSRHFCRISDYVYRFSPVEMTDNIRKTIHGHDERIPLESITKCVEFYLRLMKNF